MHLSKVVISGYKSISSDSPQTIELEHELTTLIGHNGTGKSAVMEAINKLFAVNSALRRIERSDFHTPFGEQADVNKQMIIEAWFRFPSIENAGAAIPELIDQLTLDDETEELLFRVRLEASLSFDYSVVGDIEENIWVITGSMPSPGEDEKIRLSAAVRNAIQVHYVPANRDPLAQLKYSSKAMLGRLLKAVKWNDADKGQFEATAQQLGQIAGGNPALTQLTGEINSSWESLYKGRYLQSAKLDFPVGSIDELLQLTQLYFSPDEMGGEINADRLSDGQKSLLYFALTKSLCDIDKSIRHALATGEETHFDPERLKLPIYSLIALEEPENHLAPHYLGRILKIIKEYGAAELCQAVISTHSTSIVGRIEPQQIRHFSLDVSSKSTAVTKLALPTDADEKSKFISEAVKAFPEIYFAKLVILGEGDSEQIIIPKVLEVVNTDVDANSITVAPLGGRHVNHFWRLLESINVPYITLLDLDLDRNGGGYGRLSYVVEQLNLYGNASSALNFEDWPAWNDASDPRSYILKVTYNQPPQAQSINAPRTSVSHVVQQSFADGSSDIIADVNILSELEAHNVFFSSPIDIDYSLIAAFPEIFCIKDEAFGERGPVDGKEDEEEKDAGLRITALIKAVLKKGNAGNRHFNQPDDMRYFLWYRYRFLGSKSKPATHVRMWSKIEEKYTSEQINEKLPRELKALADQVGSMLDGVIE